MRFSLLNLFDPMAHDLFAVVDGAAWPGLLPAIDEHGVEHACLFSGALGPSLQGAAPYAVALDPASKFPAELLPELLARNAGIMVRYTIGIGLAPVRRHLREFLRVLDPDGNPVFFRYYDPRVMRVFLPTCMPEELDVMFGPADAYLIPGEAPSTVVEFTRTPEGDLHARTISAGDAARRAG